MSQQPTANEINQAREFLIARISEFLHEVLGYPPEATRPWVESSDLRDLVKFCEDGVPDILQAVPLVLLDIALAQLRRDNGLTDERAQQEYEAIKGEVLGAWPDVFNANGEVDIPTWEIGLPGGVTATVNPVGRAMDEIEKWMKRRRPQEVGQ